MCSNKGLDERLHITELFSIYAPMLTDKQRLCLSMQLDEDFSLSEIGESLGVSRQAVHTLINRTRLKLEEYEAELGLAARQLKRRQALSNIYQDIAKLSTKENSQQVAEILSRLEPFTSRG